MLKSPRPALIVIDVQQAIDHFDAGYRNNPDAEKVIGKLLKCWRENDLPLVHVRHASKFPGSPYHPACDHFSFKADVQPQPGEKVVTKSENCAFIDTDLHQWLQSREVTEVVICGVLTNNSIDATVRVAAGYGYSVLLPQDATAAFPLKRLDGKFVPAEDVHWIFLSNLHHEYALVCSSSAILATDELPQ